MSTARRFERSESGQAIFEVALFAPILLALLIGVIDLGRLSQFDTQVAAAARAGASYGALNLVTAADGAGMQNAAKADAPALSSMLVSASNLCKCADGSSTTCTATACSANHRLLYVTVTVAATFHPLYSYLISGGATVRTRTATLEVGQ